jgi:hypothetical protein
MLHYLMESDMPVLRCSDDVIEALVIVACGEAASDKTKFLYRESLRNLVRLAKAERTREIQLNFTPAVDSQANRVLH